jgi:hypothetical protein
LFLRNLFVYYYFGRNPDLCRDEGGNAMNKWPLVFSTAVLVAGALIAGPSAAQEAQVKGKGGAGPCLASCLLGPRVGQEMNEGQSIDLLEVLPLLPYVGGVFRLWIAYDWGYQAAGGKGFLASCCIGPRVGKELQERKVRTKEKLLLVPIVNLYPWISMGLEAYSGKTMAQIEKEENLRK